MSQQQSNIVCFGEVLWDLLPTGKVAGGAPLNVAFHSNQLRIATQMISKVGADDLGKELIDLLNYKGVDTSLVQRDDTYPTGTVKVSLDATGSPTYDIVASVAWDFIQSTSADKTAVKAADAFVFGSLAARNETTKNTLLELLKLAKFKVLDVNLRSPFYDQALLTELLVQANMVKMNDEELQIIASWLEIDDTETKTALQVKNHFNWQQLIVTRGARGAWLFTKDGMINSQGTSVQVQDTIGSGDAFLAAFLSKFLQGEQPVKCLQFATATGAFVATKKGGTPDFSEEQIWELLEH